MTPIKPLIQNAFLILRDEHCIHIDKDSKQVESSSIRYFDATYQAPLGEFPVYLQMVIDQQSSTVDVFVYGNRNKTNLIAEINIAAIS